MADGWRVVSQNATERFAPGGKFEQVVEVTIETARGTTKTFNVPEGMYSPTYVKSVVDEWVSREEQVHNL